MKFVYFYLLLCCVILSEASIKKLKKSKREKMLPLVINTWPFLNANAKAWDTVFVKKLSAVDAVERGCRTCEDEQCDGTVGFGGSPDEQGETTLDAIIMDGSTMNVGAVGALRQVKEAISVARHVLEHTSHTLLVGELASDFAFKMGFTKQNLTTSNSSRIWQKWRKQNCQPNYWMNVKPDSTSSCGPYSPLNELKSQNSEPSSAISSENHDTIGMIVIDSNNNIAAGTSTNGLKHKIPGRVGDSPIPGAGAYADNEVGAACGTGDGDIFMRFLPSFLSVEEMRRGASPSEAAHTAIQRIAKHYPTSMGAVVVANKEGEYAAACMGMQKFSYSVCNVLLGRTTKITIPCINPQIP